MARVPVRSRIYRATPRHATPRQVTTRGKVQTRMLRVTANEITRLDQSSTTRIHEKDRYLLQTPGNLPAMPSKPSVH